MVMRVCCGLTLAVVSLFAVSAAQALPPLPKYVQDAYKDKPEYAQFSAAVAGLKSKCDLCHIPKADKKAKGHGLNDFGHAMHEHLDDGAFKKAHMEAGKNPAMGAAAAKMVVEALQKSEADKKSDGKTYGELMKAGELPGTN